MSKPVGTIFTKILPAKLVSAYKGHMARRLAAYGVHYDDLLVETPDVQVAVSRLSAEEQVARTRRIKRAFDLSSKHEHIHVDEKSFNPDDYIKSYLAEGIEEARAVREESDLLNKPTPF